MPKYFSFRTDDGREGFIDFYSTTGKLVVRGDIPVEVEPQPKYHDFGGLRFRFTSHEPRTLAPREYGKFLQDGTVVAYAQASLGCYWPLAFVEAICESE